MNRTYLPLPFRLILFVVLDLVLCMLMAFGVNFVGQKIIDQKYLSDNGIKLENIRLEKSFQQMVQENQISSGDQDILQDWVRQEGYLVLQIYKGGYLIFSSESDVGNTALAGERIAESDQLQSFQVTFADGVVDVKIESRRYLLGYQRLLAGSILIFAVIFLITVSAHLYKSLHRLDTLSRQISLVEDGNLDQEITVTGQDEIGELASHIEKMRCSFADKMYMEEQLQRDRDKLMAEMAHDMRVPLTALLMYLGLLKSGECDSESTRQDYLEKAYEKTLCIQNMIEDLFSYLKIEQEKSCKLEQVPAPELIYEFIAEITMLLEKDGFQVEEEIQVPNQCILFSGSYMNRIAGNVVSNIRKYADRSTPVKMTLYREEAVVHSAGTKVQVFNLTIRNKKMMRVDASEVSMESMGLGLCNIRKMMEQMAGDMFCMEDRGESEDQVFYELRLLFRITDSAL